MDAGKVKKTILSGFVVLLLGAGFFVFAQDAEDTQNNIFEDYDQDGLSNEEELIYKTDPYNKDTDGDGYGDYTEISTGYDPLKPAPGDKIIEDVPEVKSNTPTNTNIGSDISDLNLTDRAVTQISTLVESGDMENLEINVENIDELVSEALAQGSEDVPLPEIDISSLKIIDESYEDLNEEERKEQIQKDVEEYVVAMTYIFSTNMGGRTKSYNDVNAWLNSIIQKTSTAYSTGKFDYVDDLSASAENMVEQMLGLDVPEVMLDSHVKGLRIAYYALTLEDISVPVQNDPLGNIVRLSRVQGLVANVIDFTNEIENQLLEIGFENIPTSVFNLEFANDIGSISGIYTQSEESESKED